jgi:hypothetical protein
MDKPETIVINDQIYYNSSELQLFDPDFFYGCARTVRKIINKKSINTSDYIFASFNKKKGWTIYDKDEKLSNKAKLYLSEDWTILNIPKMSDDDTVTYDIPPIRYIKCY